jgi:hypothetical protein
MMWRLLLTAQILAQDKHTSMTFSSANPLHTQITFHTADQRGAGTDACVSFELFGNGGATTGPVAVRAPPTAFQRGGGGRVQL